MNITKKDLMIATTLIIANMWLSSTHTTGGPVIGGFWAVLAAFSLFS